MGVGRCYPEHRAGSSKISRRLPERRKEEGSGKTFCAETHGQKSGTERGLVASCSNEAGKEEVDKVSRLDRKERSMPA